MANKELGLLGEFPDGKLNKTDQGAVRIEVSTSQEKVIIKFGTPTAWVGMTADEARSLARLLTSHALSAGQ